MGSFGFSSSSRPCTDACFCSRRPQRPRGFLCFLHVHPCVPASWFGGDGWAGGEGGLGWGMISTPAQLWLQDHGWVIILFSLFLLRTFCCCVSRVHPAPLLTRVPAFWTCDPFLLDAHFEVFAGSSSDPFAHFAASVGAISARSPLSWCRLPAALPRLRAAWLTLSRARSPLTPALRAACFVLSQRLLVINFTSAPSSSQFGELDISPGHLRSFVYHLSSGEPISPASSADSPWSRSYKSCSAAIGLARFSCLR